jgi:tetratricopeptide (TPR) repeat protein
MTSAVALRPYSAGAHTDLGYILGLLQLWDEAIFEYHEAIRLKRDSAPPHVHLGSALLKKKDVEGAIREYMIALSIDPDNVLAHISLGDVLRQEKKDPGGSVREYRAALPFAADNFKVHFGLAEALQESNNLEHARREYKEALRINASIPWAHRGLGDVLQKENDLDGAIREYRIAVDLGPDFQSHYELGRALLRSGKRQEAIGSFKYAMGIDPEAFNLSEAIPGFDLEEHRKRAAKAYDFFRQGEAFARLGQWRQSATAYECGLASDASATEQQFRCALLHLQYGDREGYHRACDKLLQSFGDSSWPLVTDGLARILVLPSEGFHDLNKAIELSERIVSGTENHPYYPWFLKDRAVVEYRAGHYQAALGWLDKAEQQLSLPSADERCLAYVYFYRAMVFTKNGAGDRAQARAFFERGVRMTDRHFPQLALCTGGSWEHWVQLHMVRAEAEKLLGIEVPNVKAGR